MCGVFLEKGCIYLKNIIRYIFGYLRIIVEGDYVERFINLCSYHKIELWDIRPRNNAYEMYIRVSDFKELKPIIKKTTSKVVIRGRYGLPFFLHRHRKRKCFLLALLNCVFLLYISTFFIWDIQIEGNLYCTEEVLIEALQKENIFPGIQKEKIDCNVVAQFLRQEYENVTWASVYIDGVILNIHLKENNETLEIENRTDTAENIVAESDGKIVSIITRSGVPLVHEGDNVAMGDVLVSGELEIKNDAQEVVEYQYLSPEANIMAEVEMGYIDTISINYKEMQYTGQKKTSFWLETKDKVYGIGTNKVKYKNYTVETKSIELIPGIKFGIKTVKEYENITKKYSKAEYIDKLTYNFSKFCEDLEKKGVQILRNSVKIYTEQEQVSAKGIITVCKDFGIKREITKKELQEGNIYGNPRDDD